MKCFECAGIRTAQIVRQHPAASSHPIADEAWVADRRIKAVVVAAPALGFAFSPRGLQNVRVPVQLWRAEDDHILPAPDYAETVVGRVAKPPDYHVVPAADHFDFLAPCSAALAKTIPMSCQERRRFDRAAFR